MPCNVTFTSMKCGFFCRVGRCSKMEITLCVFTVSCGIWFPDLSLAAYGEFLFQSAPRPPSTDHVLSSHVGQRAL